MGIKVAVIGGGSTYTPELVEGIALRHAVVPVDELVLHDIDPAAPGDRRRPGAAHPAPPRLRRTLHHHDRPRRGRERGLVRARPAPRRRHGGAPARRDHPPAVRLHRPGDDRPGRLRQGAAHGAGRPGHRRRHATPGRAGRLAAGLHQPVGSRHAGAARPRPSRHRSVQRADRLSAPVRRAARRGARTRTARARRPEPPVVGAQGDRRRRRPSARAHRPPRRRPGRRDRAAGRAHPPAARRALLLPALLLLRAPGARGAARRPAPRRGGHGDRARPARDVRRPGPRGKAQAARAARWRLLLRGVGHADRVALRRPRRRAGRQRAQRGRDPQRRRRRRGRGPLPDRRERRDPAAAGAACPRDARPRAARQGLRATDRAGGRERRSASSPWRPCWPTRWCATTRWPSRCSRRCSRPIASTCRGSSARWRAT